MTLVLEEQWGTMLLLKSKAEDRTPHESLKDFKIFLNYLLPECGYSVEFVEKREELFNMTHMQSLHRRYIDSDLVNDDDV